MHYLFRRDYEKNIFCIFLGSGIYCLIYWISPRWQHNNPCMRICRSSTRGYQSNNPLLSRNIFWDLWWCHLQILLCPVFLPFGAQVTSVIVFYEDDSTLNFSVSLQRRNMYNGSIENMCTWTTSSDTSGWQTHKISPISKGNINTTGYAYFIRVYFSNLSKLSELSLLGVRINYNAPWASRIMKIHRDWSA